MNGLSVLSVKVYRWVWRGWRVKRVAEWRSIGKATEIKFTVRS